MSVLFGGQKAKPAYLPPPPSARSVAPSSSALTAAAYLASQGNGYGSTIKSGLDGSAAPTVSSAKLLGQTAG